jgi:hypothetical protein
MAMEIPHATLALRLLRAARWVLPILYVGARIVALRQHLQCHTMLSMLRQQENAERCNNTQP